MLTLDNGGYFVPLSTIGIHSREIARQSECNPDDLNLTIISADILGNITYQLLNYVTLIKYGYKVREFYVINSFDFM